MGVFDNVETQIINQTPEIPHSASILALLVFAEYLWFTNHFHLSSHPFSNQNDMIIVIKIVYRACTVVNCHCNSVVHKTARDHVFTFRIDSKQSVF